VGFNWSILTQSPPSCQANGSLPRLVEGPTTVRPTSLPHELLKKLWRYHVITAFRKAHRNGERRFPAIGSGTGHCGTGRRRNRALL
jgi:hypothetical protein